MRISAAALTLELLDNNDSGPASFIKQRKYSRPERGGQPVCGALFLGRKTFCARREADV